MNKLISLVLLEVRELQELLRDSVLSIYKKKHIEVGEELDVSEDGIQPMLDSLLEEQVNWVIMLELKSTKKSTELEKRVIRNPLQLLPI